LAPDAQNQLHMLNYIWGGLIVSSLAFALVSDIGDFSSDRYRNGSPLPVSVSFDEGYDPSARLQNVTVRIAAQAFSDHFHVDQSADSEWTGTLLQTDEGRELRFAHEAAVPEPLETICAHTGRGDCRAALDGQPTEEVWAAGVVFRPVRWGKMNAIASAALDFAETAVTLALGLIGGLGLWMGLLKIAEASGLLYALIRLTQPAIRLLFPKVPRNHPALGMIVLNLTANMLGLGNAATPLGIKAMQELQTLNPTDDTATDSMVMLLAMNTASVQLVPPVLLVAIMGLQINQLFFSIVITTALSLVVAIAAARLLGCLKRFRLSS